MFVWPRFIATRFGARDLGRMGITSSRNFVTSRVWHSYVLSFELKTKIHTSYFTALQATRKRSPSED